MMWRYFRETVTSTVIENYTVPRKKDYGNGTWSSDSLKMFIMSIFWESFIIQYLISKYINKIGNIFSIIVKAKKMNISAIAL